MNQFSAKKDKKLLWIPFGMAVLFGAITFIEFKSGLKDYNGIFAIWSVFFLINLLFFLIQKYTSFEITSDLLICRSLFFKKEIPLNAIKEIEKSNAFYAGTKFSTSFSGLIVSYEKFEEIFITPEREDDFIHLISLNRKD